MSDKYILNAAGEPERTTDLITWARWFQKASGRTVKQEKIRDSTVSTVFLAFDHSFGKGPPILWETMVFGGPLDQEQDRCSGTREQAEAMHNKMCERVRNE